MLLLNIQKLNLITLLIKAHKLDVYNIYKNIYGNILEIWREKNGIQYELNKWTIFSTEIKEVKRCTDC